MASAVPKKDLALVGWGALATGAVALVTLVLGMTAVLVSNNITSAAVDDVVLGRARTWAVVATVGAGMIVAGSALVFGVALLRRGK